MTMNHTEADHQAVPHTPREEALEQALREADRRKDELLGALGHELRNPMSALAASVQLLRQQDLSPERRTRALDLMQRQIFAMASTVDDMLELSRLNRGRIDLVLQVLDLAGQVACTLKDRHADLEARNLHLDLVLPQEPLWVAGDSTRLNDVLVHLLREACQEAPQGSHLRVLVERGPGQATVAVQREGPGLHPEDPDPFQPFGGLVAGSSGLGLSLARGLVELHGGSVRATSDGPDGGLGLEFCLPLAAPPSPTSAPVGSRGLDVLVIEDEPDLAEMMALLLESLGHHPRTAGDGEEGLKAARLAPPDVILCDLGLPGDLDGLEVARRWRLESPGPVLLVALTGAAGDSDRAACLAAGFDVHLAKPPRMEDLTGLLDSWSAERNPP